MLTASKRFRRVGGYSLVLAGILFVVIGGLSALLPFDDSIRQQPLFAWRQGTAIALALLLLPGATAIYTWHPDRDRLPVTAAFVNAVIGTSFLIGHEWQELFLARDLAVQFPATFDRLEHAPGLTPFDWGALVAVGTFTVGWLALAAVAVLGGAHSRWGGLLVIAGMFALPLLTAALGPPFGPLAGSAILGAGFARLGLDLLAPDRSG